MKHLLIAFTMLAAVTVSTGCCKKSTIQDVGEEISEASDIAKLQLQRCRDDGKAEACDDVVKKLDNIARLATKLSEKAGE